MYKAVQEDTETYKDSVNIYNKQIEALVATIK